MIKMNEQFVQNSQNVLKSSLDLKQTEILLIVADNAKKELAQALYTAGKAIGAETLLFVMKEREKSGQEPPVPVAEAMKHADVVICITEHSLTHTKAKKEAVAAGARVATMPGITADMFLEGAISADYREVERLTKEINGLLTEAKQVRIEKGEYTLTFSIDGRKGIPSTGVYRNKGESGNLPSGEAFIAPIEGSANGQILVDGSLAGLGKVTDPVILTIENGRLTDAKGGQAEALLSMLGDGDGRQLAEFGVGTNEKARITGVVLEDEKVYGTIHVAFGSNHTFGGTVSAGVHIDGVVIEPTVYLDEHLLIEEGKFKN